MKQGSNLFVVTKDTNLNFTLCDRRDAEHYRAKIDTSRHDKRLVNYITALRIDWTACEHLLNSPSTHKDVNIVRSMKGLRGALDDKRRNWRKDGGKKKGEEWRLFEGVWYRLAAQSLSRRWGGSTRGSTRGPLRITTDERRTVAYCYFILFCVPFSEQGNRQSLLTVMPRLLSFSNPHHRCWFYPVLSSCCACFTCLIPQHMYSVFSPSFLIPTFWTTRNSTN